MIWIRGLQVGTPPPQYIEFLERGRKLLTIDLNRSHLSQDSEDYSTTLFLYRRRTEIVEAPRSSIFLTKTKQKKQMGYNVEYTLTSSRHDEIRNHVILLSSSPSFRTEIPLSKGPACPPFFPKC